MSLRKNLAILVWQRVPRNLAIDRDGVDAHLQSATRHAWVALELALAGPSAWQHAASLLPQDETDGFRQQMEVVLDLFSLAGLEINKPDVRRHCRDELRKARQTEVLALYWDDELPPDNAIPQESEWQVLWQIAGDLQQAGFPYLAGLIGLRTPWCESLCLGVIDFFLARQFQRESITTQATDRWRCLELVTQLLQEHSNSVAKHLDQEPITVIADPDRSDRSSFDKFRRMASAYFQNGDLHQATVHFTAALKLDPSEATLYAERGDAYRLQCEYERAIADYHIALQLQPETVPVLLGRAFAYQQRGEHERAIADCDAVLQIEPTNAAAYRTRAAAHADRGAHESALADLTQAIVHAPEDDGAHYHRGVLYAQQRDFVQALADLTQALRLNPHHLLAYLQRGHVHFYQRDHGLAVADYTEVLRRHPTNVRALISRGRAYQLQSHLERAIADFSEVLRLEADNVEALCLRAIIRRQKGEIDQAKADLDEAIRLDPDSALARYHRGNVFISLGQLRRARGDLDETLRLQPRLRAGYLSRALVHEHLGKPLDALADCAAAVKLSPRAPAALLLRGIVLARLGRYTQAADDLTNALQLDSRTALLYVERSVVYSKLGKHDLALSDCDQAILLEPSLGQVYLHRSFIHHQRGEIQEALADYARALQIDSTAILAAADPTLTAAAQHQRTQRIADYIDGLRAAPQAAKVIPALDFAIMLAPIPPIASDQTGNRNAVAAPEQSTDMIATSGDAIVVSAASTVSPAQDEEDELVMPSNSDPADVVDESASAAEPPLEETVQVETDTDSEIAGLEIDTALNEILCEDKTPKAFPRRPRKPRAGRDPESVAAQDAVQCPNCMQTAPPAEKLREGRLRCARCKSVFRPSLAKPEQTELVAETTTVPVAKKRPSRDRVGHSSRGWRRPLAMAGGTIASLLVIYFLLPVHLWGKSDRVPVFPVIGKIDLEGQPIAGAAIYLHPVATPESAGSLLPRPRAVVNEDGSFALGTYLKDDGAPAGEYKLTVQWFKKATAKELEGGALPRNLLNARYSSAETTPLAVQITAGENRVPLLRLKR